MTCKLFYLVERKSNNRVGNIKSGYSFFFTKMDNIITVINYKLSIQLHFLEGPSVRSLKCTWTLFAHNFQLLHSCQTNKAVACTRLLQTDASF